MPIRKAVVYSEDYSQKYQEAEERHEAPNEGGPGVLGITFPKEVQIFECSHIFSL